jgi:hypothetical protein
MMAQERGLRSRFHRQTGEKFMITIWLDHEPTLEEVLSDSITKAIMAADGVDPHKLRTALRQLSRSWPMVLAATGKRSGGALTSPNRSETCP